MSNSSFLLFPFFLLCRCTLYHLLLKSFILALKAFFFNHCSLYLTLFDLYTSVIFTRYHHQVKTWSGTHCLFGRIIFQGHFTKLHSLLLKNKSWPTKFGWHGTIALEPMVSLKMCEYLRFTWKKFKCYLSFCKKILLLWKRDVLCDPPKSARIFLFIVLSQQPFDHFMFTNGRIFGYIFILFKSLFHFSYIPLFLIHPVKFTNSTGPLYVGRLHNKQYFSIS